MNPPATVAPPPDYEQLKSAILGAATNPGTNGQPLGNMPEIANLYAAPNQVANDRLRSAAPDFNTGVDADQQAKAAAMEVQRKKDLQDPGKYQRVKKQDGGFAFLAPDGTEVSAYDYANIVGTTPDKALQDSENPIDLGFQEDYKNLQEYISAKLNSNHDEESKAVAQGIEEQVPGLAGMDIAEVIKKFKEAYPTVFGGNKPGVQSGATYLPSASSIDTSGAAIGA